MKKFFIVILFFFITNIFSEIIEIKSINEIIPYLPKVDLVLFDLDNTILEKSQVLGSDQWFDNQLRLNEKKYSGKKEALDKTILEWYEIESITKVNLVEKDIKDIIDQLQASNVKLMGLTTRGPDLAFSAIKQLNSLNVDLEKSAPLKKNLNLDEIYFRKGILFANGVDKGVVLDKFLKNINLNPISIIFIDDKLKHLIELERFCKKNSVKFIGFRYGFLDFKRKNFDVSIAKVQYENFKNIMSDDEAKKILGR